MALHLFFFNRNPVGWHDINPDHSTDITCFHLVNLLTPASLQSTVLPMPDTDTTVSDVLELLTGLNPTKAAGLDTMKPVVLKELANEIAPVVTVIFQLSMDTGPDPPGWKQALVTSLFMPPGILVWACPCVVRYALHTVKNG